MSTVPQDQADPVSDQTDPEQNPSTASGRSARVAKGVFIPSAVLILAFLVLTLLFPQQFTGIIQSANSAVTAGIGWYYVLLVAGFVVFCLVLAITKLGEIRLGRDDEEPEYGIFSWFAMLFAAGMGIGLVFWGAAEPLNHLATPPPGVTGSPAEIGQRAMTQTFLHWGVHAWAIYVIVGLAVAYAVHRRGRPVSIRWALEPLLGRHVHGFWGNAVDTAAVVGTLFGVATSLGLGVNQIYAGLVHLGILPAQEWLKVLLVVLITAAATLSVVTGLDKGIKWLSNANMVLAALLLVAVLALGPTLFVLRELVQSFGQYVGNFVTMAFSTLPFQGSEGEKWLGSWTTYYWGWWISWSPFVGIFIARISRGRTVREFIAGVLLVPTLITCLWFAVIGGTALYQQIVEQRGLIGPDGSVDQNTALFDMLQHLPGGAILAGVAILLVLVFFVTSSDSGSFVVDMLSHGGSPNPPVWSRVFWATLEGAIAAVLLLAGLRLGDETLGLSALQAMVIMAAAPFSVVMVMMCISLVRELSRDARRRQRAEERVIAREIAADVRESLTEDESLVTAIERKLHHRRERKRTPR